MLYAPTDGFSSLPNCGRFYHKLGIVGRFGSHECHDVNSRLDMYVHLAFKTGKKQNFPHISPFFAHTNWSFVRDTLKTAVLKGFYIHINQFGPLTSVQCHFFPLVHRHTKLSKANFFWAFKSFQRFWYLSLPLIYFTIKQLLWQVLSSIWMTWPAQRRHFFTTMDSMLGCPVLSNTFVSGVLDCHPIPSLMEALKSPQLVLIQRPHSTCIQKEC